MAGQPHAIGGDLRRTKLTLAGAAGSPVSRREVQIFAFLLMIFVILLTPATLWHAICSPPDP
jgi:hypothetical protein